MSENLLYKGDDGTVIEFDEVDDLYPIRIGTDWLFDHEALEVANAIIVALGATVESPSVNNIVTNNVVANGNVNESLIAVAAEHDLKIEFRYAKGDGAVIEQRSLVPEYVNDGKAGKTVVGFDPDRNDVRAYRLDRIKGNVAVVA